MKQLIAHTLWPPGLVLIADGIFFGTTEPFKVTSYMLIIAFGLFAASCYLLVSLAVRLSAFYGLPVNRHRRRLSAIITSIVTALAALQTIGQLASHDIVVLLPLCIITYLYVSYSCRPKLLKAEATTT